MDIFIGFLYGVCGTLIGGLAAHFLNRDREKRTDFNKAAAKLRSAFAPTLAMIYLARHHGTHDRPDDDKFIKDNLPLHAAAIEEFRPFVPMSKRNEYQQTWEDYRKAARDDIYMQAAEEWATAEEENRDVPHGELIEMKIHKISQYAEIK